jgi:hypothetical protein
MACGGEGVVRQGVAGPAGHGRRARLERAFEHRQPVSGRPAVVVGERDPAAASRRDATVAGSGRAGVGLALDADRRAEARDVYRLPAPVVDHDHLAIVVLPESFEDPSDRLPLTRAGWGIAGGDASSA